MSDTDVSKKQLITQSRWRFRSLGKYLLHIVLSCLSFRSVARYSRSTHSIQTICRPDVKLKSEKHSALLKKALATTLIVAVPGGMLLGLAYLLAKKKPKPAAGEPAKGE